MNCLNSLGNSSCKPLYKANDKLNMKISLFTGDITKLEIDAIANAGESQCAEKSIVYIYLLGFVCQEIFYCFQRKLAIHHKR